MSKHILYVYKDYFPVVGGIENNLRDLAEAFAGRGYTVTVLVCNRGRRTEETFLNGVHIIKAGRWATAASTPLSTAFPAILRRLRPDITHLHSPYPLGEVAQLLAGTQRPYVVTYHADVTRLSQRLIMIAYSPLLHLFLRRAACVLATSPQYAATSPCLRPIAGRIRIVTSSVDIQRFTPPLEPRPTGPTVTLLFVGRMRHYKGVDYLLRAMCFLPANIRLVLAGSGPQLAAWEKLASHLGLAERVTFLGEVPDAQLPALYQAADVFVLPSISRAEALGLVILEAMAAGLPCVTTELGTGTSYLVQNEVTGLVVPPRSPSALAAALTRLAASPEWRVQMGRAGRQRCLQNFTKVRMIEQVEEIYHEVI